MPFTGSHPAAVLPLLRLGLPPSALVIGSMVPDLPYFAATPVTIIQTHSLDGVLVANLLLGVCVYLVWHVLLVPALVWVAPAGLQQRVPNHLRAGLAARLDNAADLGRLCLALSLGALSHVAWDALTHADNWGPRTLPLLNLALLELPLFRWLHLASSVAGLACITWFVVRWWRRAPVVGTAQPLHPIIRWGLAMMLLGWAGWAAGQVALARVMAPGRVSRQMLFIDSLVAFLSTLGLCLIGGAALWHLFRVGRPERDQVSTEPK